MPTKDFKAPKPNTAAIQIAKILLPFVNRWYLKGLTLDIDAESIERLKAACAHPTVLAPNHTAHADPAVMFLLSKRLSQTFYYMAARETFDKGRLGTIQGFLLQRMGAYSIVRGTSDRNAFRMTRKLLSQGTSPVVIFAEGEISRQNDTVMRFERGTIQLCFWALDDMKKANVSKSLYVFPIGIKYRYTKNMWNAIDAAMTRLEYKILPADAFVKDLQIECLERYERLRRIGVAMLGALAKEYHLNLTPKTGDVETASLTVQIQALKEHILSHAENIMGIQPTGDILSRVRNLKNLVDAEVYRDVEQMTAYERKIHEQQLQKFQLFYPDLERLINFIAISDGYVAEKPSPERYLDVITRLEKEVFGAAKMRGPRSASIRVGNPMNLANYYEHYRTQRRETVEQITVELETTVQNLVAGKSE